MCCANTTVTVTYVVFYLFVHASVGQKNSTTCVFACVPCTIALLIHNNYVLCTCLYLFDYLIDSLVLRVGYVVVLLVDC